MIEKPQSFFIKTECLKATEANGYRRELGESDGWARYGSTTAQGTLYLAASGAHGPWFLALDHAGVIEELGLPQSTIDGPGLGRYAFDNLNLLYEVLPRIYQLAVSLPDAPLAEFKLKTKDLPQNTETERWVVQRVGQNLFRDILLAYWQGGCPITGITDLALLRASHIKPWKDCDTDDDRLDCYNGLLLSSLWDAAFDAGLVSFDDNGSVIFSPKISHEARSALGEPIGNLDLNTKHKTFMVWHRAKVYLSSA
ncbi:HNH endonuclease [Paracoccaceae bacterium]|nr:HNH endonuclease [Paracoccaceae bacterium]